ncbi:MAG: SH3 domain-containing protein [Terriglobales bacterium]
MILLKKIRLPLVWLAVLALLLAFASCKRAQLRPAEYAYVAAPLANLRDRVSAVYNKTGTVRNGQRVEILEKSKRFVKVKTDSGESGWIEQRYLVDANVYAGFEKLRAENNNTPVQAHGTTRASLNMHIAPGRETEHLFQLAEGAKLEILKRETAEKPQARAMAARQQPGPKTGKSEEPPAAALEDWSLVRDAQRHTGWVLARMVDVDIPLEIAQYAEGQRIVGYFVLNEVPDADKKVPQFLVLMTENKDGLPWDYDQARIFTWNTKRHRYETAYRERRLEGVFPASVGREDFGKEGVLPTFTLRVKDDAGNVVAKKYKLNGPIVRRVLSPGEEPTRAAVPRRRKQR